MLLNQPETLKVPLLEDGLPVVRPPPLLLPAGEQPYGQPANRQQGVTQASLCLPRLESPTRSLLMEAPKGIQILAEAGDIQAICRNELRLESKDGEVGRGRSTAARLLRLQAEGS